MDCILPGQTSPIFEFDSFYRVRVTTSNGQRPSYVDRNILLLGSGETFRISKIPEGDYARGEKIQIVKSAFSGNIKEILFLYKKIGRKSVGIFLNGLILYPLIIAAAISLAGMFYNQKILNILLVVSTMFMFVFGIGYLFT